MSSIFPLKKILPAAAIAFASNCDNNNFDTNIIIRSRQTRRAGPTFSSQETASTRIRLQKKLQVRPISTQARPIMPMLTKEKEAKHSPTVSDTTSTTDRMLPQLLTVDLTKN
ncbi:hypothetical protein Tco_1259970 [Tanacetum coccineum]